MMKNITKIAFALLVVVTTGTIALAQSGYTFTTGSATNITQTSATISGSSSGSVTQTWVEINIAPAGQVNVVRVGQISGPGSTSGTVTGLRCNTTYFYQAAGMVAGGMTNGTSRSFTTSACDVAPQNVRIINFSASPSYFSNGGGTTNLSWSSENASSCTISGIGSVNTNGTQSRYVGSTQSFTLTCNGTNGGSDSRTVTVQVETTQVNNFRIDSFTASPTYLSNPGNTNLSWSTTNASSCSISNEGTVNVNGSRSVYVSSSRSLTLTCNGVNGGSDSRSVYITVDNNNNNNNPVRIDSFYASPSTVSNGGYTTLYWNTQNASSCTINGSSVNINGSRSAGPFYGSQNYTLTCYGVNGGSDSRTLFITTNGQGDAPTINTFNVVARSDNYVNINWSSNADYCIAGGDWSGTKNASGSETVGPFSGTRTFTLTCYRNGQTATQTQTIFIGGGTQTQNNSAITNIATRIGTSGAQLNGIAIIANNQLSEGWFEYGRTESLGNVTSSRSIGSARTTDFSDVITGLSSNTVYYYRAVMRNSQGTFRGDIERFVTARVAVVVNPTPVTPVAPVTPTALTYSRPAFMEITVNQITLDAVREGEVEYQVNYRSLTNRTLVNTAIKVLLPEEFEYVSATRGVYSAENKTLTLNIGEFRGGEQGSIVVRARVLPLAQVGKTVVVTGYANYTVPQDAQFLAYQDEVIAYALTTIREARFVTSNTNGVAAVGFFSSELGMAFGWLLLLLILLAIIYMLRKLYLSFAEARKA